MVSLHSSPLRGLRRAVAVVALATTLSSCGKPPLTEFTPLQPGVDYANDQIARVPWSIHVVRIDRTRGDLTIHSVHAGGGAVGLATLSEQLHDVDPRLGRAVAGVNGDFYQRERTFAGDPRGLQISEGELLSAPVGGVGFWIDHTNQPHLGPVTMALQVIWPDGSKTPMGLNGERPHDGLELYTPAVGTSTHVSGGREWLLEPPVAVGSPVLAAGVQTTAVVREVRPGGNTPLRPGSLVLSAGPAIVSRLPKAGVGATLQISTVSTPTLEGARTALSGGPMLVHQGRAVKIERPAEDSYEFSSMTQRHPRSAFGWDRDHFYLVEVDGRQPGLSVGMTLNELGQYLERLGCEEAMNLDGGGSATLWCAGKIRNSPCEGHERPIANAVAVLRHNVP